MTIEEHVRMRTELMTEIEELWRSRLDVRPFLSPKFPTIVCLCGSTRFGDTFRNALRDETLAGKIVLSVGLLGHAEGIDMSGAVKAEPDELHFYKIDLCDEVLILNVGGYIGTYTRRELEYARKRGKVIRFLEPEVSS